MIKQQFPIRLAGVAMLYALGFGMPAFAQELTGPDAMPEALKDIPRAPMECRAQGAVPAEHQGGMSAIDPDFSCGQSVPDAHALLGRANAQLVDLRLPVEYAAFHIEGAINLNAEELHIKPYWKNKAVILVGTGKGEADLYRECRRLKQAGYKNVHVMRGGMATWVAYAQPVSGRAPSAASLMQLSEPELWREAQSDGSVILVDPAVSGLGRLIPGSTTLSRMDAAAISSAFKQVKKKRKHRPVSGIVLVTKPGADENLVARLQRELLPMPLWVYTGTAKAYGTALAAQKAMWKAQAQGPRTPSCG